MWLLSVYWHTCWLKLFPSNISNPTRNNNCFDKSKREKPQLHWARVFASSVVCVPVGCVQGKDRLGFSPFGHHRQLHRFLGLQLVDREWWASEGTWITASHWAIERASSWWAFLQPGGSWEQASVHCDLASDFFTDYTDSRMWKSTYVLDVHVRIHHHGECHYSVCQTLHTKTHAHTFIKAFEGWSHRKDRWCWMLFLPTQCPLMISLFNSFSACILYNHR